MPGSSRQQVGIRSLVGDPDLFDAPVSLTRSSAGPPSPMRALAPDTEQDRVGRMRNTDNDIVYDIHRVPRVREGCRFRGKEAVPVNRRGACRSVPARGTRESRRCDPSVRLQPLQLPRSDPAGSSSPGSGHPSASRIATASSIVAEVGHRFLVKCRIELLFRHYNAGIGVLAGEICKFLHKARMRSQMPGRDRHRHRA